MRKILFLLAMLLLTSCSNRLYEYTTAIDYSSFCQDGFRITPFEYSSVEFEVIGEIYTKIYVGKPSKDNRHKAEKVYTKAGNYIWDVKYEYMIESSIEKAKKLGANGLMNFDISLFEDKNKSWYTITGVAVKFK